MVTHRSMVNTWECDELGHMNMRHYLVKGDAATAHLAAALGLGPRALDAAGRRLHTRELHVRFLGELHAGAGLYIRSHVVEANENSLRFCHELYRNVDRQLSATLVGDLQLVGGAGGEHLPLPAEVCDRAAGLLSALSAEAAPRGLLPGTPLPPPSLARADELGLAEIFRGVLAAEHCDRRGLMHPAATIAAISDGMNNFFPVVLEEDAPAGEAPRRRLAEAALEYHMLYHRPCTVGSLLTVRSAMLALGEKTHRHLHWLLDPETGEGVATARAVSVSFDLASRRAVAVPEVTRRHFQELLRPELDRP